jgi:peptidoglycan hydrolase-like protein with peptidoglycan-binding domain
VKKSLSYLLAAVLLLSVLVGGPAIGPYGIDAVSAATGDEAAPAPAKSTGSKVTTPSSSAGNILVEGSFGKSVEYLQTVLNNMGYSLKVDGFYGKATKAAIEDFQKKSGLRADGMAGPKTFAKLVPATPATPAAPISTLPEITKPATPAVPAVPATPAAPVVKEKAPGIYPDVVASASVMLTTEKELQSSLGAKGTWITTVGGNVTVANDLVWTGDVRKEGATAAGRKLGIYYHSSPNIGGEQIFTLKVPTLIVQAENANLAYGTLDGNVKVQAKGFKLTNCTITGNLSFDTQEQYDSASFNDITITGDVLVAGNKLASNLKPQTITNYGKYSEASTSGDMMRASVTFKDGKAHDVLIDVMGPAYFMKSGILSSGGQGNWGKVAYSKAGQYNMVKPSEDRPADTILAWDKQISTVLAAYKKSGFDLNQFPTCQRDANHPSVLDFNKILGGKYKAFTVSETNGAIDGTKLKGAARSEAAKVDAITSCSVDVGKYLKLADNIIKAGVK